jgi:WD40 repeat protein
MKYSVSAVAAVVGLAGGIALAASASPVAVVLKGHKSGVVDIAWHPASALLASAGSDGQVIVWNVAAAGGAVKVVALGGMKKAAVAVAFRPPKGDHLAVGDAGGALHVFATDGWKRIGGATGLGDTVDHVEYAPNGNELALGAGTTAVVLSVPEYTRDRSYDVKPLLTDLAWAPFSDALALASLDGTAGVYPTHGDVGRAALKEHDTGLSDIGFSPDGRTIVTADAHGAVKIWDAINGTVLSEPTAATGVRAWEASWSPDSAFVAVGGADGVVTIISAASGKIVKTWDCAGGPARHVTFSPDGKLLAASTTARVYVWRVASGEEVATMADHKEAISALAFSPDGKRLASGSDDDTVHVWDVSGL